MTDAERQHGPSIKHQTNSTSHLNELSSRNSKKLLKVHHYGGPVG